MSKHAPMTCRPFLKSALLLFLLPSLIGCASSNSDPGKPKLPPEPPGLTVCTDAEVPVLPGAAGTDWDTADAAGAVGGQRSAALSKNRCTHDWRSFYADLRNKLAK